MTENNSNISRLQNPRIEISKEERSLRLFDGEDVVRTFDAVLGFAPAGTKESEGDGRTPEGEFYVCVKNHESKFFLSLALNYPRASDAKRGLEKGMITAREHDAIVESVANRHMPPQNTVLGGEIYIHGGGIDGDWTRGCVAIADAHMKELFDSVDIGTPVLILP